jgi:hypothetical protein
VVSYADGLTGDRWYLIVINLLVSKRNGTGDPLFLFDTDGIKISS